VIQSDPVPAAFGRLRELAAPAEQSARPVIRCVVPVVATGVTPHVIVSVETVDFSPVTGLIFEIVTTLVPAVLDVRVTVATSVVAFGVQLAPSAKLVPFIFAGTLGAVAVAETIVDFASAVMMTGVTVEGANVNATCPPVPPETVAVREATPVPAVPIVGVILSFPAALAATPVMTPKPNARAATSEIRFVVVFVDIIFLSIVDPRTFRRPACAKRPFSFVMRKYLGVVLS
jgi:hypothetical protein